MPKADDTAAKDEVVADATTTESAPVENDKSVSADNALDDDAFDDVEAEALKEVETESKKQDEEDAGDNPDESEPAKADETEPKDQPKDDQTPGPKDDWDSLNGKSQERFRQMANERRQAQRELAELRAQQARFATEQDLVNEINPETGEYYTPQEIERISWQQSREAEAERVNRELFDGQVRENQFTINDEAAQVAKDFPLLDPQNKKEFVPEIGAQYVEALNDSLVYALPNGQQANRSTLLANGINPDTQATLVGYSTSPYKLAKLAADSYSRAKAQGETIGQANAQRATERMMANADEPSGSPAAQPKDEASDFDEAWDE
jgi:hypothetical protein